MKWSECGGWGHHPSTTLFIEMFWLVDISQHAMRWHPWRIEWLTNSAGYSNRFIKTAKSGRWQFWIAGKRLDPANVSTAWEERSIHLHWDARCTVCLLQFLWDIRQVIRRLRLLVCVVMMARPWLRKRVILKKSGKKLWRCCSYEINALCIFEMCW